MDEAAKQEAKPALPEYLTENADGSVTITLKTPLEVDGTKVTALRMRESTVDDQLAAKAIKGDDLMKEIQLFANLCEITEAQVRKLTFRNYTRLGVAIGTFTD